jgi:hypothetical protein
MFICVLPTLFIILNSQWEGVSLHICCVMKCLRADGLAEPRPQLVPDLDSVAGGPLRADGPAEPRPQLPLLGSGETGYGCWDRIQLSHLCMARCNALRSLCRWNWINEGYAGLAARIRIVSQFLDPVILSAPTVIFIPLSHPLVPPADIIASGCSPSDREEHRNL